jgi:Spy/CpxP family protein refolding chaperone
MNMPCRNALLILFLGWALGATSGVLLMRYCHPMLHRGHSGYYRNRLVRDLQLSPEQTAKVDAALQRNREKLDTIFAQDKPEIEQVRQGTQQEIRQLLTPEQQARFDQLQAKIKAHFDRELDRRMGPHRH